MDFERSRSLSMHEAFFYELNARSLSPTASILEGCIRQRTPFERQLEVHRRTLQEIIPALQLAQVYDS
eukprot:538143-Amphidinium_carterae.1